MKNEDYLVERAKKAGKCYLERNGYEILDTCFEDSQGTTMDIVAKDTEDDYLVFASVRFVGIGDDFGKDPGEEMRSTLENCAAEWLSRHEAPTNMKVRFDAIVIRNLGNGRALLRHHINCLS